MLRQRELTVQDYICLLRRHWLMVVLLAVTGGGLGYGVAHFLPKRFTSQTLVLVQQPTVPGDYVKPVVGQETNQRLAAMQQEILSRTRLEPIIQQFDLYRKDIDRTPMEALVERLRKAITVTPIQAMAQTQSQGLPGFTVSVNFEDPHLAQRICATITSMFMEKNLQLRQQQAEQTTQFLAKQLDDAKAKLDDQDAKLAAFKRRNMGSLPGEEQANLNLLMNLASQLDATTQALSRAQQDKSFAQSMLAQQQVTWQAAQDGRKPETYQQQLSTLEAQFTSLRGRYTDDHPDVIKMKDEIEALKANMVDAKDQNEATKADKAAKAPEEPAQIQSLRAQIHQYDQAIQARTAQQEQIHQQIKRYQARVESSPAVEQDYKELTRDYQTALEFYNDLLKKRHQSAMATDLERRQQGEQFQVLDPANLPDQPSFPKKPLFALGGIGGGLALGLGLALLLEMQDTSLRTEKNVETLLGLPVLSMIPALRLLSSKKSKERSLRLVARA